MSVTRESDGSLTIRLVPAVAANLLDVLREWEQWAARRDEPECQNWKRSPIARENRRESVVYGNCLDTVLAYLGRRELRALMAQAEEETE